MKFTVTAGNPTPEELLALQAVLANHKLPTQCKACCNHTDHFDCTIVASKDIKSAKEIYVEDSGDYKMHGTECL